MGHLYIAAAHKSSGKTSVSIGLTAALTKKGLAVQPFKKGPDFIDPLWLTRAAGRPCYNLDFFIQGHAEIVATFAGNQHSKDIAVIEGNHGLFDGIDPEGADSNAAMSKLLGAPVVLVIDTGGMARGIAPLIRGYLDFDPEVNIGGVILNKVGGSRHEAKLRAAIERYTDTEVLGAIGRDAGLVIPERHLGLVPANEARGQGTADATIARLADAVAANIDLDRIISLANTADTPAIQQTSRVGNTAKAEPFVRIAIARDAAFGFYYQDDLEAFTRAGAELIPFDTLSDSHLPDADGLFIGGGFPETHLEALSANTSLLADIREALEAGMPAYAECGGMMYLSRNIRWHDSKRDMVGFVPADTIMKARPQGRGYMLVEETAQHPWPKTAHTGSSSPEPTPAHEFHYARLENLPDGTDFAQRVRRGAGIDGRHDALLVKNLMAGFAHHRNTSTNPWVERFVSFVRGKTGSG